MVGVDGSGGSGSERIVGSSRVHPGERLGLVMVEVGENEQIPYVFWRGSL